MKKQEEGQAKDPIRHIKVNNHAKCNKQKRLDFEFFFADNEHMILAEINGTSINQCQKCLEIAKKELFSSDKIEIDPLALTPEAQAQIERMGYYPQDGYFEKRAYVMPTPSLNPCANN